MSISTTNSSKFLLVVGSFQEVQVVCLLHTSSSSDITFMSCLLVMHGVGVFSRHNVIVV